MNAPLRYLSVCSGIEVAALAWVPLGWQPVLVSEIEAFPREVLRIRHGAFDARFTRPADSLALWGDFTALRMRHLRRLGIDPADIDVLVGGTPCQGFSVAGLRGSLSDPRGGLSLAFLRLAHAIQSARARAGKPGLIVVWENVPGVLNTPDNALGCFLAALVGADDALRSPLQRGRWPSAGMVSGPRARAAWRVLDAQHFGLAQRRERVFAIGSLGDGPDPAEVLFEPEGLRWDSAPSREAAEDVAPTLAGGARSSGGYSTDDVPLTIGTLDTAGDRGGTLQNAISGRLLAGTIIANGDRTRGAGMNPETLVAHPLRARHNASHRLDSDTYVPVAFGGNRQSGPVDVATALQAHSGLHGRLDFATETFVVTPFDTTQITNPQNRSNPQPGGVCHPLSAQAHPPAIAFDCKAGGETGFAIGDVAGALRGEGHGGGHAAVAVTAGVRRLMPTECEALQGVPRNFTRIPWRGQPEELCPDGPRYRVLGNAYPKPVLAWLGRRIGRAVTTTALEAAE